MTKKDKSTKTAQQQDMANTSRGEKRHKKQESPRQTTPLLESSPENQTPTSPSSPRQNHNKKSIRPPILFHREYKQPHGYLSQWFISPFTDSCTDINYNCAEQYMMHHKALLFNDSHAATAILSTPYPKDQKALGRCIGNWNDDIWDQVKEKIVEKGNFLKFSQNDELKEKLIKTGERELVEASRSDRVWGVGFDASEALARREEWGSNLLGKCLMRVRERIREEEEE